MSAAIEMGGPEYRDGRSVREEFEQWIGQFDAQGLQEADSLDDIVEEDEYDMLLGAISHALDIWRQPMNSPEEPPPAPGPSASTDLPQAHRAVARLRSKDTLAPLLPSLVTILISSKPDDAVTEEVLEILGYEEMDLVFEVVKDRKEVGNLLANHESNLPSIDETVALAEQSVEERYGPVQGKAKGKQMYDAGDGRVTFTAADAKKRMDESLKAAASRPLFSKTAIPDAPIYPHIYSSHAGQGNVLSSFGTKFMLPLGTTRVESEECEEVIIPPARSVPPKTSERLISVAELDPLARGSFPGYKSLNRIQSIIYPTAYKTNENLLICAPTGAGKTDVAMLTILRVLDQHRSHTSEASGSDHNVASSIQTDDFKIIYVAPMKALASEIVRKLGKRLAWLSIRVRELTGDMQMTKAEIAETQIIVTTPEKWDVVTRKPTGEGELASKVKLLIIDEVHLLNEDRGAVIETIVARTLRQVESSQSLIRIVGLSATLPNYLDVAEFLGVSPYNGLFYFDSSFRPVPLEQHFIGVKGKTNSPLQRRNLDKITFEKVSELVKDGHQVMVFVHARKETVKSALALKEAVLTDGEALESFDPTEHPQWEFFRREISASRNKEMKELFDHGFGIHHAGMLRSDRNMMEKMFGARAIKVLFCTATLAWGVNLPAHAVLIKGTQVYDSTKGSFVNLSVLDVLQIFGRAGRPGMESSGVGYICTPDEDLDHYLNAVTTQLPIESQFISGMTDSLNAEVSLGTVTNVDEAAQWLGYTYLFVRMVKNPMKYGMPHSEPVNDPGLEKRRRFLVTASAQKLASAQMLQFDKASGTMVITDIGRIAAKYYIRHSSIVIFNETFKPVMSEADVLEMLSRSTEFDQIKVRENELQELQGLMDGDAVPCQVNGGTDTSKGKVNILLQAYISRAYIEDFALVSDTAYAAQNGGRIIRSLFEIAMSKKWANASAVLMAMSKAIEKRMWPFAHPLTQSELSQDLLYNLQRWADDLSVVDLASRTAAELGQLVHLNEGHGKALLNAAKRFPTPSITYSLRPLTFDLLKLVVRVGKAFEWSTKSHGTSEPFWIWVEDAEGVAILQWAHLAFKPTTDTLETEFVIAVRGSAIPSHVTLRFISDRWIGAEEEVMVDLENVVMPGISEGNLPLFEIPFLGFKPLGDPNLEKTYAARFGSLNGMQTQSFWTLFSTAQHSLICAPPGSGKTLSAHSAIWREVRSKQSPLILVISSGKVAARDFADSLRSLKDPRVEVELELRPEGVIRPHQKPTVRVTSSACLLRVMEKPPSTGNFFSGLSLVVFDDLDKIASLADYEIAASLLVHATQSFPVRLVGLSASVNDSTDLAAWLHVQPQATFAFKPLDREQSLQTVTQSFTIPYSAALFKAMAKPAHDALRASLANDNGIIFVPSRSLCRPVATDLVTQCAIEMQTRGYLGDGVDEEQFKFTALRLKDRTIADPFMRGIGIYWEGMHPSDQTLILELYAEGTLRVLVAPRESCWSIPVRAGTVIVMGNQYAHYEARESNASGPHGTSGDRQIKNYSISEITRMQSRAVRHGDKLGRFYLFCQAEERDTLRLFLDEGLPLESTLKETGLPKLQAWVNLKVKVGEMKTRQDLMDMLSFTFLAKRLESNPVYYDAKPGERDEALSRFADDLWAQASPAVSSEDPAPTNRQLGDSSQPERLATSQ